MKNRFDSQRNPSGGICGAKNFPGAFDRIYEDNGVLIMTETATLTWFSGNYGSTMQAFALQKTVMELGYGNRIINYVPNKREKLAFFCKSSARFVTLKAKIENKKIESKFLNRDEIDLKNRKFEEFYENSFFLTEMIPVQNQMKSLNNKYRIFLCGSDQIWNPNYFKKCNFLDFVSESNKKIAYAPSIGTTQLTENEKRKMKSYLDRFDKISVREESSKRLIESVVDKPVQVVCDPVFLLSREKWIEKMQLKEPEEKYILCYFLGDNPEYQKMTEKLQERLAKLAGGVAVIKVGAATEIEMKEKKLRIEDALSATKAAVEEGIVAGGGTALINAIPEVQKLVDSLDGDERTGAKIVLKALEEPVRQIAINAGVDGSVIVNTLLTSGKIGYGYDAYNEAYVDMIPAGIVDPTKVTRSALQNAASVAAMVLTTESLVADQKEDNEPAGAPAGMGGMM